MVALTMLQIALLGALAIFDPRISVGSVACVAILIAGAVESKVLSRRVWLVRGVMWWFLVPIIVSIVAVTGAVIVEHDLALLAWPFFAGAVVCGLLAWQLYDEDGAERAPPRGRAESLGDVRRGRAIGALQRIGEGFGRRGFGDGALPHYPSG